MAFSRARGLACLALATLLLLAGCTRPQPAEPLHAGQPLRLLFATDLHHLAPELYEGEGGEYFDLVMAESDGKLMRYTTELVQALVDTALAERPDAVLLGGDLTFNGEAASHSELAALLAPLRQAGIPVLVIPGNHDINQPDAYRFLPGGVALTDAMDEKEFWQLYAPLGAENHHGRDSASMSYVYKLREDYWVLMVDTGLYASHWVVENGTIRAETLAWMEDVLAEAQAAGAEVLTVTHHNLLVHHPMFTDSYVIGSSSRAIVLMEQYGAGLNLSGHMHIQHISVSESGLVYDIATGGMSVYPHYYAGLTVDEAGNTAYEAIALPVDFAEYSAAYFAQASLSSVEALVQAAPADDREAMAAYARALHTAYFRGEAAPFSREDEGYALWLEYQPTSFFTYYLGTMLDEELDSRILKYYAS